MGWLRTSIVLYKPRSLRVWDVFGTDWDECFHQLILAYHTKPHDRQVSRHFTSCLQILHLPVDVDDYRLVSVAYYSGGAKISKRGVVVHVCAQNFRSHAHFRAKPRPFRSFLRLTTSPTCPIDLFSNEFSSKAF